MEGKKEKIKKEGEQCQGDGQRGKEGKQWYKLMYWKHWGTESNRLEFK